MNEYELKLLKMAINMGYVAIKEAHKTLDYCDNAADDYWCMVQRLSEKLGVDLDDALSY